MNNSNLKRLLFGIGNILHGDDGVGCYVAENLHSSRWITIDCATAPENFSGQVTRYQPYEVVVVDAALMGLPPGTVRRIDTTKIQEVGFSTHTLSLSHFISYISEECSRVTMIGIEPQDTSFGLPLSPVVQASADRLIHMLLRQDIQTIETL